MGSDPGNGKWSTSDAAEAASRKLSNTSWGIESPSRGISSAGLDVNK